MRRTLFVAAIGLAIAAALWSQSAPSSYVIETIAGVAPLGDGGPAAAALLLSPSAVAADNAGNLYVADTRHHRVRKVDPLGRIATVAGDGTAGFSGDGGPASAAQLNNPSGLAVDGAGNLYISDTGNQRIRRVATDGGITTVAGSGTPGFSGDGADARSAQLFNPRGLAVDRDGNLYITDSDNHRVRQVSPDGLIKTIAGTGVAGFTGDGGLAVSARINSPYAVAVDDAGNLYIADRANRRVRRVGEDGFITTIAGTGVAGFSGDGGPAVLARLNSPSGLALDNLGSLYIADSDSHRVRRVAGGVITIVAGTGGFGFSGDGGPAEAAQLDTPLGLAIDQPGYLYIADGNNHRVRRVSTGGLIITIAGSTHYGGDGGSAAAAQIFGPRGITLDAAGNLCVADTDNNRIRKVTASGLMTTLAGSGPRGFSGDAGPASAAQLSLASAVAVDASGNLYIADSGNNRIRKVTPAGSISTVAGAGASGFGGDGGAAAAAQINGPRALAFDAAGNLYVADTFNHRVRKIAPAGLISTVAGTGEAGFGGDGQLATSAQLNQPYGLAIDSAGGVFIADANNHRVRRLAASGVITTVAGNGTPGYMGDGGPAISAQLKSPRGLAVDGSGNLYIADADNRRIRRVTPSGLITTIAGNGRGGFSGDGGLATLAEMDFPVAGGALAADAAGNIYLADELNDRIRKLSPLRPMRLLITGGNGQTAAPGGRATNPLVVRVVGTGGIGVPGVVVSFAVEQGSATLSAASTTTASDGAAGVEVTIGNAPGPVTIAATAAGLPPVKFTLTAVAPAGFGASAPRINAGGIVGAGLSTPAVTQLSPGGIATIFGRDFAPPNSERLVTAADLLHGRLPVNLGGVCVQVGAELAPIFHVFAGQINFQSPNVPVSADTPVQVILNCGEANEIRSNIERVAAQPASPEFFYFLRNADGRNPIAALHALTGRYLGASGLIAGVDFAPAAPGEIVTLFATGLGATDPAFDPGEIADRAAPVVAKIRLTVGGLPLSEEDVLYAGAAPLLAGVYQLNIRVPASAPAGDLPVSLRVGDFIAPPGGYLTVRR